MGRWLDRRVDIVVHTNAFTVIYIICLIIAKNQQQVNNQILKCTTNMHKVLHEIKKIMIVKV